MRNDNVIKEGFGAEAEAEAKAGRDQELAIQYNQGLKDGRASMLSEVVAMIIRVRPDTRL